MRKTTAYLILWGCIFLLAGSLLLHGQPGKEEGLAAGEVAADGPIIALTFDDGPSDYTIELAQGLADRGVKATFFVLGKQVEKYPEETALLAELGHQIGSHGYDHSASFTVLSDQALADQLDQTIAAVEEAAGVEPVYVRPPYGSINKRTAQKIPQPLMLWTLDTRDWATQDADSVRESILSQAKDGSVVILHDGYPTTVEGVLEAVDTLLAEGWQFVTLEEYYAKQGMTPEPGQVYRGTALADIN